MSDGGGVVGYDGSWLYADLAAVTGLGSGFADAFARLWVQRGGHVPERGAVDLAVLRGQA